MLYRTKYDMNIPSISIETDDEEVINKLIKAVDAMIQQTAKDREYEKTRDYIEFMSDLAEMRLDLLTDKLEAIDLPILDPDEYVEEGGEIARF